MAIKEFRVGVGHTINIGNYESLRVEADVLLIDFDNWDEARRDAQKALSTLLDDSFRAQAKPAWFENVPSKKYRR